MYRHLISPESLIILNKLVGETGTVINVNSLSSTSASIMYYDDKLTRLCSVVRSVMQNHPFQDGNKRTGILLLRGGCHCLKIRLVRTDDEYINFAVTSVTQRWTPEDIASWVTY